MRAVRRRRIIGAVVALALGSTLALAGCGGGDNGQNNGNSSPSNGVPPATNNPPGANGGGNNAYLSNNRRFMPGRVQSKPRQGSKQMEAQ